MPCIGVDLAEISQGLVGPFGYHSPREENLNTAICVLPYFDRCSSIVREVRDSPDVDPPFIWGFAQRVERRFPC